MCPTGYTGDVCDIVILCDAEHVNTTFFEYFWPESMAGNVINLPCALGPAVEGGTAKRTCNESGEWDEPDFTDCLNGMVLLYVDVIHDLK